MHKSSRMNITNHYFLFALLFPSWHLIAQEQEPVPIQIFRYQGRDVPLYDEIPTLSIPAPDYPDAWLAKGIEGVVVLLIHVSSSGDVIDAVVKSSTKPAFGDSAKKSALNSKYPVVMRNGVPTEFMVQLIIQFKLKE